MSEVTVLRALVGCGVCPVQPFAALRGGVEGRSPRTAAPHSSKQVALNPEPLPRHHHARGRPALFAVERLLGVPVSSGGCVALGVVVAKVLACLTMHAVPCDTSGCVRV